ncbi:MAG TPA: hypothetical protein VGO66_06395 [Solirubrobacterales bacterium]|nr:hypothetical protein [Solirubrobacterales bacterium]
MEVPVGAVEGEIENLAQVEGGGALPGSVRSRNEISQQDAAPAVDTIRGQFLDAAGGALAQAGATPFSYKLGFARSVILRGGAVEPAGGSLREVRLGLPRGLVAALNTASPCSVGELESGSEGECPDGAAVGTVETAIGTAVPRITSPLYAVSSPGGAAAAFGFRSSQLTTTFVIAELHDRDGGISVWISGSGAQFRAARITLWGEPADPGHDRVRGKCLSPEGNSRGSCPTAHTDSLLRLPTSCDLPRESTVAFDTELAPGSYNSATSTTPAPTGCDALRFEPTISVDPSTMVTDSPTAIAARFSFGQGGGGETLSTADLRRLSVTLPAGLAVNPAGASGRVGCEEAQIDLDNPAPAGCPDESKIGSVQIRTPLAEHPLTGSVYLASPDDNPFSSLFALYLVVSDEGTGVTLKLAGKVDLDPETGGVTIVLDDLPQVPIEDVSVDLFGGERAPLRTPLTCGAHLSIAALRPWSAPYSGPDTIRSSVFALSRAPDDGACPQSPGEAPHKPSFSGGVRRAEAGSFTSLVMRIVRADGSQGIGSADVSLPPGLLAKLAGIPLCEPGGGWCPPASRVGSISTWAGAGPLPIALTGGAYLAGPYKGAPVSLIIEVPAVAGPFDLGTVRSRVALSVDAETAQLRVQSDAPPTILSGVPLDLRVVRVQLDRRDFILNPTDCDLGKIEGRIRSLQGAEAPISVPFQIRACADLGFEPELALRFFGPTHRSANPKLRAVLAPREGDASIERATVVLPKTEYLENSHIRAICTRARFEARACPARSIYGFAKAWSPLLDRPLQGPVYLRSSTTRLPALVVSLDGQIQVDLVGRIDSVHGRIRLAFEKVPDVPLRKFELTMPGGRRGLLVNNAQLCRVRLRASASFRGHNGKSHQARPVVRVGCGERKRRWRAK